MDYKVQKGVYVYLSGCGEPLGLAGYPLEYQASNLTKAPCPILIPEILCLLVLMACTELKIINGKNRVFTPCNLF